MDASNNPSTVNVKLVAPIDNVADDVNINIPPDMQSEVILEIFQMYAGKPLADITNDTVDLQ